MNARARVSRKRIALGLQGLLRQSGFELRRYRDPALRRVALMREHGVELLVDVGANRGQYAAAARRGGYEGLIVSFEPLSEPFAALAGQAACDPFWRCFNFALGDESARCKMTVTANYVSSSLLPVGARHRSAAPGSWPVGVQEVPVVRLDHLGENELVWRPSWLKIDVQGFEDRVLAGADGFMPHVRVVEAELSLVPLYEGQPLACELISSLAERGFELFEAVPAFHDPSTGALLQLDALFAPAR